MRRAVLALAVTGVFLTGACGTASSPTTTAPTGAPPAADPAQLATKSLCEGLGEVYSKNMGEFAQALSKMVESRKSRGAGADAQQQAQQSLSTFAGAVRSATQSSADPQVRADGKQTADQLQAKAGDKEFFSKINTAQDVDKVVGPTLKEWLAPVQHHCS